MRRILFGVVALLLVFTQISWPTKTSAEDQFGFIKDWETSESDRISMFPAISKDGTLYGITMDDSDIPTNRLVCLDDGKIAWKSQEEFSFHYSTWPTLLCENMVIAAGAIQGSDESKIPVLLMVCYSTDGKKIWDKKVTFSEYVPYYDIFDGKLWITQEKKIWIYDTKTGEEIKKISLDDIPHKPPVNRINDDPPERKDPKVDLMVFSGHNLVMVSVNYLINFEITDDLSLKYVWEKSFELEDEYISYYNYSLAFQAENGYMLALTDESTLKCIEISTGIEVWSFKQEYIYYNLVVYDGSSVLLEKDRSLLCLETKTGETRWEVDYIGSAIRVDSKYAYTYNKYGRDDTDGLNLLDVKTGIRVAGIKEPGLYAAIPHGESIFIIKEKSISKYTSCNPCACKVDAYWQENKMKSLETEICPMQEKTFELTIENPNEKAVVECNISTEQDKITLSDKYFALKPGESKVVKVIYTSSIDEPDITDYRLELSTNCNQKEEFELHLKKSNDCKKLLIKQWELKGSSYFKVGNKIVYYETVVKDIYNSQVTAIKAINIDDGKTAWTIKADQFIPKDSQIFDVTIKDNTMLYRFIDKDYKSSWQLLNAITGKILWKRNGGEPLYPDDAQNLDCDYDQDEVVKTFFNPETGKTVIDNLKLECESELRLLNEISGLYVFQNGKDGWRYSDDPVDIIGVDSKGKILWTTKKFPCINWETFKGQNLYLTEQEPGDSENDDNKSNFILTRNDPKTLETIWSFKVFGYPHILSETKDRLIISSVQGIFCIGTAKGDLIWKFAQEKKVHYKAQLKNNMILLARYEKPDDFSYEDGTLFVLSSDDGKVLFEKVTNKGVSWEIDKNNLFLISTWYDGGQYQEITKYVLDGWEEVWTVNGKGDPKQVGDRIILADFKNHIEWFDSGKPMGKLDLQISEDDSYRSFSNNSVAWADDYLYVEKGAKLYIINAKTSEITAKISEADSYSSVSIQHEKIDYSKEYQTPCFLDNRLFLSIGRKLVCLSLVK